MIKNKELYSHFEDLAQKLDLKILKGKGDFIGGTCVVNKKTVIVVNKHKPIEQRLKTLANSFLEFDLDKVYVVPAVRAYICLLYTSPSPRDVEESRMPSSA